MPQSKQRIPIINFIMISETVIYLKPCMIQAAPIRYRSTVLSIMETMFGVGLMIGPFLGSVLYEMVRIPGVNFTNILRAAFKQSDLKSANKTDSLTGFLYC